MLGEDFGRKEFCETMYNKYEIVVDGGCSSWLRPSLFLYGDVVPLVI